MPRLLADPAEAWRRTRETRSRLLQITLGAAILFHLLLFAVLLFAPRLAALFPARRLALQQAPPQYATIQMIMQNTKTAGGNHILKDKESNPGHPGAKPQKQQTQAARPAAAVPVSKDGMGTPSAPSPNIAAAQAAPAQPASGGNPGTGLVSGLSVIPASPDDKHPNVAPAYPELAGVLGQQGTVKMLIHIDANGRATSVDITQPSGYLELDETARNAALGWHYRPVTINGRRVPSELPFAMQFSDDSGSN